MLETVILGLINFIKEQNDGKDNAATVRVRRTLICFTAMTNCPPCDNTGITLNMVK